MKEAKNTILRQWTMLQVIPREPRSVGTRELRDKLAAEGFQVDVRTIQRDLEKLSGPFPLTTETKGRANRWSWMKDGMSLNIPGMDAATALAFRLAEDYLTPLLPQSTLDHLAPHFHLAREVLKPTRGTRLSLWPEKVCRMTRGPDLLPPMVRPEVHATVCQALLEDRQLEVSYKSKEAQHPKCYPVNPLGLVFLEGVVYLVCTAKDYPDIIKLALHRMSAAKPLHMPCRRPEGFDLHAYTKQDQEFAYPFSRKPVRLRAVFDARAATLFSERQLSKQQRMTIQKDGRVLLQATVLDTLELRWWLQSFGDRAEILAPKALRKEFAAIARQLAEIYR